MRKNLRDKIMTHKTRLLISKTISYIRNKMYCFIFDTKIKLFIKNKVINYQEFLREEKGGEKKDIVVSFVTNYKIKCNSIDLSAIGETCILEDYEKTKEFEIKEGDIVFDIGAHIGSFSIHAANKGAVVYAFEPLKDNYNRLVENIKINNYQNKIKAYNYGIYNEECLVNFSIDSSSTGGNSVGKGSSLVQVRKLENIMKENNINKIDLLKMDVEGSEYKILPSLTLETYSKIDKIVGEYHLSYDDFDKNFKLIKKILRPFYKKIKYKMPYYFYASQQK